MRPDQPQANAACWIAILTSTNSVQSVERAPGTQHKLSTHSTIEGHDAVSSPTLEATRSSTCINDLLETCDEGVMTLQHNNQASHDAQPHLLRRHLFLAYSFLFRPGLLIRELHPGTPEADTSSDATIDVDYALAAHSIYRSTYD